ncbi:hypothetical protein PO909_007288 [Leuciscus waleckii]
MGDNKGVHLRRCVKWQAGFSIFLLFVLNSASGQIRYSVPEEMRPGLFVGDVAKDLGLDVKRLVSGRARLVIDDSRQYVELNRNKGHLVVKERIDREQLCGQKSPCSFGLEILLENPLEFFSITIEIQDINDHAPVFSKREIILEISESTPIGTIFLLDAATDPDVGLHSLQSYSLKPTDNFALKQHSRSDGSKYAEMVLQSVLDREKQSEHSLILTAIDGGDPPRSGTVKILVTVLDANDNAPIFTETMYKASVAENAVKGTLITKVSASDADQGFNGNVTYSFTHMVEDAAHLFQISAATGDITLTGNLDYEAVQQYELNLQAKDPWGLTGASKLVIDVVDVNDNSPIITMTSFSGKIQEDSPPGTIVALISVQDVDSGKNGQVRLNLEQNSPFTIKPSPRKYYTLVTDAPLDREKVSSFNLTLVASDEGSPSLFSKKTISLDITDINDNAPAFSQREYKAYILENNSPGVSLLTLQATDPDAGQNARIAYYIIDTDVNGSPVSTYFSVNADNGIIHAVRSFDYEQMKEFKIHVRAQDGGSPPLGSNATVLINVQDQNDNAPQVLYPVQSGVSVVAEIVPRSADVGYLVTKVVAVDVDSGQNAWLSYKLQKATDRALFEVGLQNGEIRTVRQVTDKDAVKQRLTVVVEDNGQPSRSATVNVNVAVADSFPEVLSEFTDFTHDKEYNDNLTFYLVLALAAVSFLFITCLVVIISVKIYRWRQSRLYYQSSLPVIPYYPPRYADTVGTGTLQHVHNYEIYRTTDSRKSDVKYFGPVSQSLMSVDVSGTETIPKETQASDFTDAHSTLVIEAQVRYSVPEEMVSGSMIGDLSRDLGLSIGRLRSGRARVASEDGSELVQFQSDKGILLVKKRIDREEICGQTSPCSFSFEIVLENPMELFSVTVEILDINDNSPAFPSKEITVDISESAMVGAQFILGSAVDPDVGINTLQGYSLKPTTHFSLKEQTHSDGSTHAEMVLDRPLDREHQAEMKLTLTATDGGSPQRTGTVSIRVIIQDANDNAPIFTHSVYKAFVSENSPKGALVTTVSANDKDEGAFGHVTYYLDQISQASSVFSLNPDNGEIRVLGNIDYEKVKQYQLNVMAKDKGSLSNSCKVIVEVTDVNDNVPVISLTSFSNTIAEDSPTDTTVAIISVKDADSGKNGLISCSIGPSLPFKMKSTLANYYTLVSDGPLDRETVSEYNITITVADQGSPPLSNNKTLVVRINDVNDNEPVFDKSVYSAVMAENNSPGHSITCVHARDADSNQNARVAYLLEDVQINGESLSSLISVNAETGVVYAMRSFDYEKIKSLEFSVKAQDGGAPTLSTSAQIKIQIQDQNDNAPQVLYPVQSGVSVVAEIVPRSADVGYLVTKVVAVDVDSGQNAWLSYKLQKATDRALFEVGLQNGEIRTVRQVTDKDAVKQRLTVVVEDNGQPSRSATVSVNVAVADSFPEVLSEFTDFTHDKEYNDNLTFYLVLALAGVSFLFITCLVVIISVKIYRWRQSRMYFQSNLPVIPYYPPRYADTVGTGTLQHAYNYEVYSTTDSRRSDCKFARPASQGVLIVDAGSTGTVQRAPIEKNILDEPDSSLQVGNTDI